MKKHMKNNVFWVGKVDWELRRFHGDEFTTNHGSSYNSYLIQEEKTVLIDTVWMPYGKEFVDNLSQEIDLHAIDCIIANHGEVDHSGALPELMKRIPDVPIYCTANAVKSLKGQYHQDWNFRVVKSGDKIDIGNGKELVFVEMTMLHWPDSMATYLTGDNILFSNDAFGQHFASELMYNDLVDPCILMDEALKYFANILSPFTPMLRKKLDEIKSMDLAIDIIAPSHGIIWRDRPMQIVEQYTLWADDYQTNQTTIIYDTMWGGTKRLAEKIAEGIRLSDPACNVRLFNVSKSDLNNMIAEVFRSKSILVGSSTISNGILHSVAGFVNMMKEMRFKKKKAASFGCYGWSGESTKILSELLREAGFNVVNDGLKIQWNPDEAQQEQAVAFGKAFAAEAD